jgi:hypothetical protein
MRTADPAANTRQVADGHETVSPAQASAPGSLRDRGEPLPSSLRAFFEPRFNHDLGHVRVHAHAGAAASAREVGAHAYTIGRDIVFGTGKYAPETGEGRHLLAHELTHVIQQAENPFLATTIQRQEAPDQQPAPEQEEPSPPLTGACGLDARAFTQIVAESYAGPQSHGASVQCEDSVGQCIWQVSTLKGTVSVGVGLKFMPSFVFARKVPGGERKCYDYQCAKGGGVTLTPRSCS